MPPQPPAPLIVPPSPELRPWVRGYLLRDDTSGGGVVPAVNHLPGYAGASLNVVLAGAISGEREGRLSSLFWSGPLTRPLSSRNHGAVRSVTVLFEPGMWHGLVAASPDELCDRLVDADLLHPRRGVDLAERMAAAGGHALDVLEAQLRDWLSRSTAGAGALAEPGFLRRNLARHSVRATAGEMGLSVRQLERRIKLQFGLSPKLYQRLARFDRLACRLAGLASRGGLAGVAAELEFSDQSHLVREYKAFAGYAPTALAARLADDPALWIFRLEGPALAPR